MSEQEQKFVQVDLNDLEKLVFTTGAMKTVEGALQQRREDPFVRPHLAFTEAHNRLASIVRDARRQRADVHVWHEDPLTKEERQLLRDLYAQPRSFQGWIIVEPGVKAPTQGQTMSVLDRLMIKRCVTIGQLLAGAVFPGEQPRITPDPKGFAVLFTQKGISEATAT